MTNSRPTAPVLTSVEAALFALGAAVAFQLAYTFQALSFLVVVYLYCLVQLARLNTTRLAFYVGLLIGLSAFAPQLMFFWKIFGAAAIPLWLILAFWLALFLVLARLCQAHLGRTPALLLIPFLWTGLEYFRSELYYLRFSWLNAGYAFSDNLQWLPVKQLGVYGMGFLFMAVISLSTLLQLKQRVAVQTTLLVVLAILSNLPARSNSSPTNSSTGIQVAGVQMEFPLESQIIANLTRVIKTNPQVQLLVLSEYSVDGPVPETVKTWCQKNRRYLIIGGKDPAPDFQFYDTAFVIGPSGDVVFRQAKSVPIQFFKDGLPARKQKLWESPWGKIGICICYDLSYTRVTDQLIRLGAQALIVPSMDAADWGRQQHALHARVAPVRAAEYGVPIFRLASSGISQIVSSSGLVLATAPMPGEETIISDVLDLKGPGRLPLDRMIAPLSVWVTGLTTGWLAMVSIKEKNSSSIQPTLT
jgi:apolipoprotein N-acyltransferase